MGDSKKMMCLLRVNISFNLFEVIVLEMSSTKSDFTTTLTLEDLVEAYPALAEFLDQIAPYITQEGVVLLGSEGADALALSAPVRGVVVTRGTGPIRDLYFKLLKEGQSELAAIHLHVMRLIFGPSFEFLTQEQEAQDGIVGLLADLEFGTKNSRTFGSAEKIPDVIALAAVGNSSAQYGVLVHRPDGSWSPHPDSETILCAKARMDTPENALRDELILHHLQVETMLGHAVPLVIAGAPGYACLNDRYCSRTVEELDHSLNGNPKTGKAFAFIHSLFEDERINTRLYLPNRNKGGFTVSYDTSPAVAPLLSGARVAIDVGSGQTQVWVWVEEECRRVAKAVVKPPFDQKAFLEAVNGLIEPAPVATEAAAAP
jgi:hypothetical protein